MRVTKLFALLAALVMLAALPAGCGGGGGNDDKDVAVTEDAGGDAGIDVCVEGDACDDGDLCTEDDTCNADGVCEGVAKDCDDGLFCNGVETCDPVTGVCAANTPLELDDGVVCTVDACDEATGEITHTPDHEGCEDGNECTDNVCDPEMGGCKALPNDVACDDGDLCTENDQCADKECGGEPIVCDDELWCNGLEVCDGETGDCVAEDVPELDDGVECTVDECDEEEDEVTHTPDDAACDDGNMCTTNVCDAEEGCQDTSLDDVDCDDGDLCTEDDTCVAGECLADDVVCDDGEFCNGVETCDPDTGDCLEGEPPAVDDGIDCTVEECDEETDMIVHVPTDLLCDDTDACTVDICDVNDDGGECLNEALVCDDGEFCNGLETCDSATGCLEGEAPEVDDLVDCTSDSCDEENDVVVNEPDAAACDDGLWCNGAEICDVVEGCLDGEEPVIDDEIECTIDSCDEENDVVVNEPDSDFCDDGEFCNGPEVCDTELGCVEGVAPELDDLVDCTEDACDEENDVVTHTASDLFCDNATFCDGEEYCDEIEGCLEGEPPELDDMVVCTVDTCDEENDMVVHTADDTLCDDTLWCNGEEYCDAVDDCLEGEAPELDDLVDCTDDTCDEENDQVVNTPNDVFCDDSNVCTDDSCHLTDGCQYADNALECDDLDLCTFDDVCAEGECGGTPKVCDDGVFCNGLETCASETGICEDGPAPVLDDEIDCTVDSCDEENDVVVNAPDNGFCDDQNQCTENVCNPDAGCETTNLDIDCSDAEECTDGDVCVNGECESGDWVCEDCGNDQDDNGDELVDCCDPLCADDPNCQAETDCTDEADNDCDGLTDCDDVDDCTEAPECLPVPEPGDLVVTEIMANPSGTDSQKEWFEIYNASEIEYELKGMTVMDFGNNEFTVDSSLVIAPDQYLVLGRNDDKLVNGGAPIDYVYSGFTLANDEDEIILSFGEVVADEVVYAPEGFWTIPNGSSLQLAADATDAISNNDSDNWCPSPMTFGDGDGGTPGAPNDLCVEVLCSNQEDDDDNGLTDCEDPACQGVDDCGEVECEDQDDNDDDGKVDCADEDCVDAPPCIDTDQDGVPDSADICPLGDDALDQDQDAIPDLCEINWAGEVWPTTGLPFPGDQPLDVYVQVYMPNVTEAGGPGAGVKATMLYSVQGQQEPDTVDMTFSTDVGNNDEFVGTIPSGTVGDGETVNVDFEIAYDPGQLGIMAGPYIYNGPPIMDQQGSPAPFSYIGTGGGSSGPALFFSEYIEGGSYNKALEIYYAGQGQFDLSQCAILLFSNGSPIISKTVALNAVPIGGGGTYVVCHPSIADASACDQTSGNISFTGNDAVALDCLGQPADIIGKIGEDPGEAWTGAGGIVSTKDMTLRRTCLVGSGDTNGGDAFDPAMEWEIFPKDTLDGLGSHCD